MQKDIRIYKGGMLYDIAAHFEKGSDAVVSYSVERRHNNVASSLPSMRIVDEKNKIYSPFLDAWNIDQLASLIDFYESPALDG